MEDKSYWLAFALFPGVGPGRFAKLLAHFGSAKAAWEAPESDLKNTIGPALTGQFLDFREKFSPTDYEEQLGHKKC